MFVHKKMRIPLLSVLLTILLAVLTNLHAELIRTPSATTEIQQPIVNQETPASTNLEQALNRLLTDPLNIPFPVYPNGLRYRIGGENGLKIVAFETTDSFQSVDNFYQQQTEMTGLRRSTLMNDYVRYSLDRNSDALAGNQPGILIHQFDNAAEALDYGAHAKARTNIIIHYH